MHIPTKILFAIAAAAVAACGIIIYFTYGKFVGPSASYTPPPATQDLPLENDRVNAWPELRDYDQNISKETIGSLNPGKYEDKEILVREDSVIRGTLMLRNVVLNLNNKSIKLESGSRIIIEDSLIKRGKILLDGGEIESRSSAFSDIATHAIYARKGSKVDIGSTQFFDIDYSALYAESPSELRFEGNDVIDSGCFDSKKDSKTQLCIRDNLDFAAIQIQNSEVDKLSILANKISGRVDISGERYAVNLFENKFLGFGSFFIAGEEVDGKISSNIFDESGLDMDIIDANGLRVENNTLAFIMCRSSNDAVHNWSDVLGDNIVGGSKLAKRCSKFE